MNPDARTTVTSETTLVELTRMLARSRVRIVDFKLDEYGEYFVKAETGGRFYCGLSEGLHLAFAQIIDEIGAGRNPSEKPRAAERSPEKKTCKWCGAHAVLRRVRGESVERRRCAEPESERIFCEARGRGERGADKQPRRTKEQENSK